MSRSDWIGWRVAGLRVAAGMTQQELADRIGKGKSYISMIENGERPVTKRSLLLALATALGVRPDDLTGEPRRPESPTELAAHRMAPAIRVAIEEPDTPIRPRPLTVLGRQVDEARVAQMACDYPRLTELLPPLIAEARETYYTGPNDGMRRDALAVLVRACMTAAFTLKTLGHLDLAVRLAERMDLAAAKLGEPVHVAAAHFTLAQMALAQGARTRSYNLAARAADTLQVDLGSDERLCWYGMLHLHAAMSAASLGDYPGAETRLDEAAQVAQHVAGDPWRMEFGPTNVQIWRVGVALENGDCGESHRAPDLARQVDQSKIRTVNRRARLYIDMGRGLYMDGRSEDATQAFLMAGSIAEQELRRAEVQEIVGQMVRDARRAGGYDQLRALAVRAGIDPLDPPQE